MSYPFDPHYPDIASLRQHAKKRIPKFAFDYLEGGCGEEISVSENRKAIQKVQLRAEYLKPYRKGNLEVELFGHRYSAPFGIAPIGLQGLLWPNSPEILAKAAAEQNIPYILSTVSSSSLERIAEVSEGKAWFQLYNPTDPEIRADLLRRIEAAQYPVLVVTVDVPTFGFRPRDIKNGLSMPPKMSLANILQMSTKAKWLLETAKAGKPEMETLKPYMAKHMAVDQLAEFMNKTAMGDTDVIALQALRDRWQGPLVIKGVISEADVERCIALGADGVVISNHGGRQLDAGESPVEPLPRISKAFGGKIKVMMDGGLRSGSDIARALASGANFTFLGRPFVYGVGALGHQGGHHTINVLKTQLQQVVEQLRCQKVTDLPHHLVRKNNDIAL